MPASGSSPFASFLNILRGALPHRWQRARGCWTPVATMVALVRLVVSGKGYRPLCQRMHGELGNLFGTLPLYASAFSQARQRLADRPALLGQAFKAVYTHAATARRTRSVTYGAYTLIALDGTNIPLQSVPSLLRHFGAPRNQHGPSAAPHALVCVAWDVGANQPVDYALAASTCGELTVSKPLLERMPDAALVIADRLYANRHVVADLICSGRQLLIRAPAGSNAMLEVQAFVASGQEDAVVSLGCFSHKDPDRYAQDDAVQVRLIRGLDADHVYITSLIAAQEHPREALLALYAKRWRIETAFRELKFWTNLTSIRARSPLFVEQEVVAILIYALLLSELDAMALEVYRGEIAQEQLVTPAECPPRTHTRGKAPLRLRQNVVRFNRACACTSVEMIITAAVVGDHDQLRRHIAAAIVGLWQYRVRVKPGRSYPRISTRPHSKWNRLRERPTVS